MLLGLSTVVGATDREGERESLRRADTAFCDAVRAKDLDRFRSMIDEHATFFGDTQSKGRDAVVEAWKSLFLPDAASTLTWKPREVEVSASGDLGFTIGDFEVRTRDAKGGSRSARGSYVTVWKRGPDGTWRAVVDIGTRPEESRETGTPESGRR
jgi:ketosteroid isomerase-like protein